MVGREERDAGLLTEWMSMFMRPGACLPCMPPCAISSPLGLPTASDLARVADEAARHREERGALILIVTLSMRKCAGWAAPFAVDQL